jgi:integrase
LLPAARHPWAHHGLVFSTSSGGPLDQARQNLALRRALDSAGLPRIRIHDLRHTAASALLADAVHPKVVQKFLGHNSIKVTLDVYSHVMPTMHAEAMRRLDLILGGDDGADDTDGSSHQQPRQRSLSSLLANWPHTSNPDPSAS